MNVELRKNRFRGLILVLGLEKLLLGRGSALAKSSSEALMSFYELYSTATPLLLPSAEWMYRLPGDLFGPFTQCDITMLKFPIVGRATR